jgi:hypothetical protein
MYPKRGICPEGRKTEKIDIDEKLRRGRKLLEKL